MLGVRDKDGDTPLHNSVYGGDYAMARALVAAGCDVNSTNNKGCTPLHLAVAKSNLDLVELFLSTGRCKLEIGTRPGLMTPLIIAASAGFLEITIKLISAGANVNAQDVDRDTSLHLAFRGFQKQQLKKEFQNNAVVFLAGLLAAAEGNGDISTFLRDDGRDAGVYLKIAVELISNGANPTLLNNAGQNSLELCPVSLRDKFLALAALYLVEASGQRQKPAQVQQVARPSKSGICICSGILQAENQGSKICDTCFKLINDGTRHFHCPQGHNLSHPNGLDICIHCFTGVGLKGLRVQVKPSVTQPQYGWGGVHPEWIGEIDSVTRENNVVLAKVSFPARTQIWTCRADELKTSALIPGLRVQVKKSVTRPQYGWGRVTHDCVGIIVQVENNGDVIVDFPNIVEFHRAKPQELHVHPGSGYLSIGSQVRIRKCIKEPRYQWGISSPTAIGELIKIEADGDVHVKFSSGVWRGIIGEIEHISESDASGVIVTSSSGDPRAVLDKDQSTYWQSNGAKGTHWIMLELPEIATELKNTELLVVQKGTDRQFLPEMIEVELGKSPLRMQSIGKAQIEKYGWTAITPRMAGEFKFIKVKILSCYDNGVNCRVNGLRVWINGDKFYPTQPQWTRGVYVDPTTKPKAGSSNGNNGNNENQAEMDALLNLLKGMARVEEAGPKVQAGQVIRNRYKLVEKIATGGFGSTWKATDSDLFNEIVVLKFLNKPSTATVEMFRNEARKLQELRHEQIPPLKAFFEMEQESQFILVMGLVQGKTLRQAQKDEGCWSSEKTMTLVGDVLEILDYVHARNILHRDIKADNIMIREVDKKVMLIDFGACTTLQTSSNNAIAKTIIGTPGYIPPEIEQQAGTFESDFFSLGALALFMLTGVEPYHLRQNDPTFSKSLSDLRRNGKINEECETMISSLVSIDPSVRRIFVIQFLGARTKAKSTPYPAKEQIFSNPTPHATTPPATNPVYAAPPVSTPPVYNINPTPNPAPNPASTPRPNPLSTISSTIQTQDIKNVPFEEWSTKMVVQWLKHTELDPLVGVFQENLVDGKMLVEIIKDPENSLNELGITLPFVRRRLKKELAVLTNTFTTSSTISSSSSQSSQ